MAAGETEQGSRHQSKCLLDMVEGQESSRMTIFFFVCKVNAQRFKGLLLLPHRISIMTVKSRHFSSSKLLLLGYIYFLQLKILKFMDITP